MTSRPLNFLDTNDVSVRPAFLLSLPRSGSTFVQRVLAAHPQVASAAEPWIQLQMLAPLADRHPDHGEWYAMLTGAVVDFIRTLPGGADEYRGVVHALSLELYTRASPPGTRIFLDKTPPYHLIVDEIARTFPDAPLIFLWRHPLSILASVVDTFEQGRWRVHRHRGDLLEGLANLVAAYSRYSDRAIGVRYETLLTDRRAWQDLTQTLGLQHDDTMLERFADTKLIGRMGDPTGVHAYGAPSREPLTKWRSVLSTPVRQTWARRWLQWIGAERLAVMGYDLDVLLNELADTQRSFAGLGRDVMDTVNGLSRDASGRLLGRRRAPSDFMTLLRRDAGMPA